MVSENVIIHPGAPPPASVPPPAAAAALPPPFAAIADNVVHVAGGRMESKCGTHLGHNLPEGGRDRYCIDLVCMVRPRGRGRTAASLTRGFVWESSSIPHTRPLTVHV